MTRTVVGLDLSLTCTGIATIDPDGHFGTETVRSHDVGDAPLWDRAVRVDSLASRIDGEVPPDALVVIESSAYSARVGRQHDRSGLWWVLVLGLSIGRGLDVVEVTPATVKRYATGRGNADKQAVRDACHDRLGVRPDTYDEADALWLAAIGRDLLGAPLVAMPAAHRQALTKVRLPERTDMIDLSTCASCGDAGHHALCRNGTDTSRTHLGRLPYDLIRDGAVRGPQAGQSSVVPHVTINQPQELA